MRTKLTSKQLRCLRRRRLALALVGAMALPAAVAQNLPTGGNVVNGTASINEAGNQMTITQTTRGAIINWGTFNIANGFGVAFNQPGNGVTLNRVLGTMPTAINGILTANGNVFIINTNGITFGANAQVNVGGLVASTLALSDGDFLTGLSTGRYLFAGNTGTPVLSNAADITAGAGGVGFVGTNLRNSGAIVANGGNIGFGAGTSVTLDFVGDGLTQVTINAAPAVDTQLFQDRFGSMTADGGRILLRNAATAAGTGGVIYADGLLRAQSIANVNGRIELTSIGGPVFLGAPGVLSDASTPFTAGRIDVSGDVGETGGSVLIQGNGVAFLNNDPTPLAPADPLSVGSFINASGGEGGGSVTIQSTADVTMLGLSGISADTQRGVAGQVLVQAVGSIGMAAATVISADAMDAGDGGQVGLAAGGNVVVAGLLSAKGAKGGGNGGTVAMSSQGGFAVLQGGIDVQASQGNGGDVLIVGETASGLANGASVNASGGIDGGSVVVSANNGGAVLGETASIDARGLGGNGGQVALAGTSVYAYGAIDAHGAVGGGLVGTIARGGDLDLRGLDVDAGGGSTAGMWMIGGASLEVVNGNDQGSLTATQAGSSVQDADINAALDTGTSIQLVTSDGGVNFDDARISTSSPLALTFTVNSESSITGGTFDIESTGGSLAMDFNADADGDDPGEGFIAFLGANLSSNGGDIRFFGGSDPLAGAATGYGSGIRLNRVAIDTAGGDVLLRGASTGADTGPDDAGVALEFSSIDTDGGDVVVEGTGAGDTGGVFLWSGRIDASGGGGTGAITITGASAAAFNAVDLDGFGLLADAGAISLQGDAGADGTGVALRASLLDSNGGAISVVGSSVAGVGLSFAEGSALASAGGAVLLQGDGALAGVELLDGGIDGGGGDITVIGSASAANAIGVYSDGVDLVGGAGDVTVDGASPLGIGVLFANGAGVSTTSGAITLIGTGANFGLDIADGAIDTDSGDITLSGEALAATATAGVRVTGGGLATNGGSISVSGTSAGGVGVQLGDGGAFAIGSGGGAISINGSGVTAGVLMQGNTVASGGGVIDVIGAASGGNGTGVDLANAQLVAGAGDVRVFGNAAAGTGVNFAGQSGISTTTGAIAVTGIGATVGLALTGGELSTESGHFDLRGRGTGAGSDGLVIGQGVSIATNGGGIELSGEGGSGAGVSLEAGSSVDAGNSLVVVRAGNDGSSDALRIAGTIASGMAVNLRPGGVDANGGLTERTADEILIGGGSAGFTLSGAELALIDAPELIIGSNLHAGAIRVLGATSRSGDLTLQNDGGSGGIDIQAALDVGTGTLALSSGGDITQSSGGAITAHSLLARAGGSVLLADAGNNVAATTLAGSAGGDFEYEDVDALAIGSVSGLGMDASSNGLASFGATGISAGGDVFVRNLAGDMTLNAGVSGVNIDLVTANTLQNAAGASLVASGDWRVWANSWVGEDRGGLAGDGNLPNLYGCAYLGQCGVTVPAADDHFIYVQQPTAVITFDDFMREYGLPNPTFTFTVSGAILGDSAANVASGVGVTTATIGSNVGNYPITGQFTSAAGYRLQFVPGTLGITPATLLFTADSFIRYLGTENPLFTGSVTGFRNGDTIESVFGSGVIWNSPAGLLSPIGFYPVNGGSSATNYVFVQAPGNATALQIIPLPQLSSTPIDLIRETVNTYVYDRNFGGAPMCALNASLEDQQLASSGDELSNEWAKVRSRPNLTNCFETERKNSCGDF